MACRSCSAGLSLLPKRIQAPLRHNLLDSTPLRTPLLCAATGPFATAPSTPARTLLRTPRRALHTTSPRQKIDFMKMALGRVAQSMAANQSSYYIYQATERLYKACAAQADYVIEEADRKAGTLQTTTDGEEIGKSKGGAWHGDLALLPTFSTWAHVTMLHLYLLVARLRCLEPAAQQAWQAQLVNHFFYHAEAKMEDVHGLSSRMVRQQYLKDLFVQWRGVILAYDEGIIKGDAVLASAVWRNLFKASEEVDVRALAAVVGWMRSGLRELGEMTDGAVQGGAEKAFPAVGGEFKTVDLPTASMKTAFEQAGITSS